MIIAFKILFFIFMLTLFIVTLRSLCIFNGKLIRLESGKIQHLFIFVLGAIIFIACFNFVYNNAEKLGFKVIEAQSSQK